jgi:hypothetical protein
MSDEEIQKVSGVSQDARIHESQKAEAKQRLARMEARQVGSQENMQEAGELMIFSPYQQRKKFETLDKRNQRPSESAKGQKSEEQRKAEGKESSVIDKLAQKYQETNPELQKKTLMNLQQQMKPDDNHEKILQKLQKTYTDKALADEAIDFLIETAETKEEMKGDSSRTKHRCPSQRVFAKGAWKSHRPSRSLPRDHWKSPHSP